MKPSEDGATDLFVASGDLQAIVRSAPASGDADAAARDRARIERELEEADGRLASVRTRLADASFTSRAPAAIVDGARRQEAELAELADRLRDRLGG